MHLFGAQEGEPGHGDEMEKLKVVLTLPHLHNYHNQGKADVAMVGAIVDFAPCSEGGSRRNEV